MILVDNRIGSKEIAPYINNPTNICRMDYADFAFVGNGPHGLVKIGVERKTIPDLLQSMTSGRLTGHQLIGMRENFDYIYLLLDGKFRASKDGMVQICTNRYWRDIDYGRRKFMIRELYAFIQSLQILCNMNVAQVSNEKDSGKWLDSAYGWWAKPWKKHKSHLQFQKIINAVCLYKPSLVTRMVYQLDGVGYEKAQALGYRFRTPESLLGANLKDLQEVDGIGKILAAKILRQLREG